MYQFTKIGEYRAMQFISECQAKRKEILDAHMDTADETTLPTLSDILSDIEFLGLDDDNEYWNGWGVTDNYDSDGPLRLKFGEDFIEANQ